MQHNSVIRLYVKRYMLKFDVRKKKKVIILLLKSFTCMIRITQHQAPHLSMEAMQSMPRPTADEAFPDTHLTACDLHCSGCSGATAAWHVMLLMLHGVTSGPATSRSLEI